MVRGEGGSSPSSSSGTGNTLAFSGMTNAQPAAAAPPTSNPNETTTTRQPQVQTNDDDEVATSPSRQMVPSNGEEMRQTEQPDRDLFRASVVLSLDNLPIDDNDDNDNDNEDGVSGIMLPHQSSEALDPTSLCDSSSNVSEGDNAPPSKVATVDWRHAQPCI